MKTFLEKNSLKYLRQTMYVGFNVFIYKKYFLCNFCFYNRKFIFKTENLCFKAEIFLTHYDKILSIYLDQKVPGIHSKYKFYSSKVILSPSKYSPSTATHLCQRLIQLSKHFWNSIVGIASESSSIFPLLPFGC